MVGLRKNTKGRKGSRRLTAVVVRCGQTSGEGLVICNKTRIVPYKIMYKKLLACNSKAK